jgi:hypothetical protein
MESNIHPEVIKDIESGDALQKEGIPLVDLLSQMNSVSRLCLLRSLMEVEDSVFL